MAFSIIVFERIPNKWVKEDSVGVQGYYIQKNVSVDDGLRCMSCLNLRNKTHALTCH